MSQNPSPVATLLVGAVLLSLAAGVVVGLEVERAHEYTPHEYSVSDVVYDEQHDVVWSIDNNLTADDSSFVGYDVAERETIVEKTFISGHAVADGDGVVYVASDNTLWVYNISTDNASVLTEMQHHADDMTYDQERNLVWAGLGGDVVAFDADTGDEVMRHGEHGDKAIESISVQGEYVASVARWDPDVVVYNIESEGVEFKPLPDAIEAKEDGNLISVHLTETGKLIIGGGWDSVFMYDIETQELETSYAAHAFGASEVRYLESRDMIVSTGGGNGVAFYDVTEETIVQTYKHDDTIYAADLDTANDVLWFGDGEGEPGTITGLQLTFADRATPTDEPTAGPADTSTPTDTTETSPGETTGQSTEGTDTTEDGTTASSPGFGLLAGVAGVLGGSYLLRRRSGE